MNLAELEANISREAGLTMHRMHVAGLVNLSASQAETFQRMLESAMLHAAADALKFHADAIRLVSEQHAVAGKDGQ